MGYTTDFRGHFNLDKPLSPSHALFLARFAGTRRMKRDAAKTALRPDPVREAAGLPIGEEGAYFVGEGGFAGQNSGPDVKNSNRPPWGQPGLWCQWVPLQDGSPLKNYTQEEDSEEEYEGCTSIGWDGGEKFYYYTEWLEYLIEHFLQPWGYTLNGVVTWQGEENGDIGKIIVENNKTSVQHGYVQWRSE